MDETLPPEAADAQPAACPPLRLTLEPGGMVIELTQPMALVGRHSGADIRLPLPDVSRRHCRFLYDGGRWRVVDLDSLNGVFLNDEEVGEADLVDGDRLRIGGFTFVVELPGPNADLVKRLFPGRPGIHYLPPRRRAS